jgi:DNA mismatch repair ATPase MutS
VLGITLTRSNSYKGPDGKAAEMAGFPHHALDTYLPKLVRAGERVAICDQLEAPRATTQHGSGEHKEEGQQAVKEMVIPAQKQEEQQPRGMHR